MVKRKPGIFDKPSVMQVPDFRTKKPRRMPRPTLPARMKNLPNEEALPQVIKGVTAGSTEEARLAVALDTLHMPYQYHVRLWGGTQRRGGLVMDFVVLTKPLPTPVEVQGSYWHTGQHADPFDVQRINAAYAGWRYQRVVEIWDNELTSVSAAVGAARKHGLAQ